MRKFLLVLTVFYSFNNYAQSPVFKNQSGKYPQSSTFKPELAPEYVKGKVVFVNNAGNYEFDSGKVVNIETDKQPGKTHYRTQQYINGIEMENAIYIQHVFNNKVVSGNGLWLKRYPAKLPKVPSISSSTALRNALQKINASVYMWQLSSEELLLKRDLRNEYATYYPNGDLVYYSGEHDIDSDSLKLAYKFDIYASKPLSRQYVFVDAITGKILGVRNLINKADVLANANTVFSGVQTIITDGTQGAYRLRETTRGRGIETYNLMNNSNYAAAVDFTNPTSTWNNINNNKDQYATDAHWGAEKTWDFFYYKFGRNSIDNAGFTLRSYVHYSTNYNNAYWDGFRMTYGDGSSADSYQPLTTLDICGHEISHGLTQYTSNLIYAGESGALNEGYSDIFGTAIENYARPEKWDWIIGGDVAGFRNMSNPNVYYQPDTYKGKFWDPDEEVHTNSGVLDFWFYLLSNGGSGINDIYCNYNVQGIGIDKAVAIAFKTNTQYLFPTAKYEDAARYSLQAAADLFGESSNEFMQTANAWSAVGINLAPTAPLIAASKLSICMGATTKLTIASGSLNSARYWQWYNGSCGGNLAGTGTSIDVSPDSTTTYYVRAEGGCVSFEECSAITVTVNPSIIKPLISAMGPTTLCTGQSVSLKGPDGFASNNWSDGSNTQTITVNKSGSYSLTVTDANGCQSPPSDSVKVIVTLSALVPVITLEGSTSTCFNATATLVSSPAFSYRWSTGEITQSIKISRPGSYSVTTATTSGCSATSLPLLIQLPDSQPPIPSISTLPDIMGECAVTVASVPTAFDSCSGLVKGSTSDPLSYNTQGDHVIHWVYNDGNGNSTTQLQHVFIKDLIPPVLVCPALSPKCYSSSGIYSIPLVTASDNCDIDNSSFKYTITGATNRNGSGAYASGYFGPGKSTLTFTVSDVNGNTNSCSGTITINTALNAAIPDVFAVSKGAQPNTLYVGYGTSTLALNVSVSGGSGIYSYSWSTGATTQSVAISLTVPGSYNYSVTVSDSKGCSVVVTKIIHVVDIRCGKKNDKVSICMVPPGNKSNSNNLCVSSNAIVAQLNNGSFLGSCELVINSALPNVQNQNSVRADDNSFTVSVWPNPTSTNFKLLIKSSNDQPVLLNITDLLGRAVIVKRNIAVNTLINVGDNLLPGTYFFSAVQRNKQVIIKAVKLSVR
jgi:bacillolysin